MADFYTKASFMVKLSKEVAEWSLSLFQRLCHCAEEDCDGCSGVHADEFCPIVENLVSENGPDLGFEVELEGDDLWVHGENVNVGMAACFVSELLKKEGTDDMVSFDWASDCSKPRLDAYGGGVALATRRHVLFFNSSRMVEELKAELAAHEAKDTSDVARCDNCGKTFTEADCPKTWGVKNIPDLAHRVDPGCPTPQAECPFCGALGYKQEAKPMKETVTCPKCGKHDVQGTGRSVFAEAGEYDGKSYEVEGNLDEYACKCGYHFYSSNGHKSTPAEKEGGAE